MSFQKFSSGSFFPIGGRVVGMVFLLLGIVAFLDKNPAGLIVGPFLFVGGSVLVFSFKGVIIDFGLSRFQSYVSVCRVRFGKWQALSGYSFISTLQIYLKHDSGAKIQGMAIDSVYHDYEYRVCFLSADHRKKVPVFISKNKTDAVKVADLISEKTGLTQVTYNPVSVSRKNRRRQK